MKVLVFAIASRSPVYDCFIRIWKAYMNSRPWITSYLVFGGAKEFRVEGDEIHMPVTESWKPGILHKTIWAFRWAIEQELDFDFVLRTNLSSFWILDKIRPYLETLPKTKVGLSNHEHPLVQGDVGIFNGSGMFFSRDIIEGLAKVEDWRYMEPDDREITRHVVYKLGGKIYDKRWYAWKANTVSELDVPGNLSRLEESGAFQIRVKNPLDHEFYKIDNVRIQLDVPIQLALFYKYYREKPRMSPMEMKLANYALFYRLTSDVQLSNQLVEFLRQNPLNHPWMKTIKITNRPSPNSLAIFRGNLYISVDHPCIMASYINMFI